MNPAPHRPPTACAAALRHLKRQLDGGGHNLPISVEAHLDDCPECRERFQAVPDLLAGTSCLEAPEPSALYTERLIAELRRDGERRRMLRRWQLAGALAAAVLAAVWLGGPHPAADVALPAPAGQAGAAF